MKRKRLTQTERRLQTRAQLVEAARVLFVEKGFLSTSVSDIAEAAGYTRGAFYCNFNDKADLLIESLRRQPDNISCKVRSAIFEFNRYLQDDACFILWAEACLLARRDPSFHERLEAVLKDAQLAIPSRQAEARKK